MTRIRKRSVFQRPTSRWMPWIFLLAWHSITAEVSAQPTPSFFGIGEDNIEGSVTCAWPDNLRVGFCPLLVELENLTNRDTTVRLEVRNVRARDDFRLIKKLDIEAGSAVRFELSMPVQADGASFHVKIDVGSDGITKWVEGTPSRERLSRQVLLFSNTPAEEALLLRWQQTFLAPAANASGKMGQSGRPAAAGAPLEFYSVPLEYLPTRYEAFTSVECVVLDTRGTDLSEQLLEPMLRWVRLGGNLALVGPRAIDIAEGIDSIAESMESRFQLQRWNGGMELQVGMGRLSLYEDAVLEQPEDLADLRSLFLLRSPLLPASEVSPGLFPVLAQLNELPRRSFTVILVLFVLLIGPVNFSLMKRMGKPTLILVSIPLIALVTSGGMLAYGMFIQGLDKKTASNSFTLLDQRLRRASTIEFRQLFAGLVVGPGLLPGSGTSCYPEPIGYRDRRNWNQRHDYRLDVTHGLVLSGHYLPPRTPVHQQLLREDAARQRVTLTRDGSNLNLHNSLGSTIQGLTLRDLQGQYHRLRQPLENGGEAVLNQDEVFPGSDPLMDRAAITLGVRQDLPLGSYVAQLERSPFTDSCGLQLNELQSTHTVVGILDLASEEWR